MIDGPLLVVSPHLDDGVLSLGGALLQRPSSVVVTVLAGLPDDDGPFDADRKRAAGLCYASQLPSLSQAMHLPERLWRVGGVTRG